MSTLGKDLNLLLIWPEILKSTKMTVNPYFSTSARISMTNCLMCVINATGTKDYTKQENLKCPEILQHTFGRI